MGILSIVRRSLENPKLSLNDPEAWEAAFGGGKSDSGVAVNSKAALGYAAFWRGIGLISRDVGKLPLFTYRRDGKGKVRAIEHPTYQRLRWKPNRYMTATVFKQTLMAHALMRGNGYAYIMRRVDYSPAELLPLLPDQTYPVRVNGVLEYVTTISYSDGPGTPIRTEQRRLPAADVLHIKGLGYDGLEGYDLISYAKDSLGLGLAARRFGATYFRRGAEPSIVLEHPNRLTPKALKNLRDSWDRMHQGLDKSHGVAILEEGMKISPFSFSARQSQLLETRQFELIDVANWLNLPPHKVGHPSRTAYASLEQENQSYLDDALDPWLVAWEEECREKLLTEEEKDSDSHTIEFLRQALLRADLTARTTHYATGIQNGWFSPDEVRGFENLNPRDDGKGGEYMRPSYMTPATEGANATV